MDTEAEVEEIEKEIAEAVAFNAEFASVLEMMGDLRRQGLLSRPTYRLTSPYGSGMQHLSED